MARLASSGGQPLDVEEAGGLDVVSSVLSQLLRGLYSAGDSIKLREWLGDNDNAEVDGDAENDDQSDIGDGDELDEERKDVKHDIKDVEHETVREADGEEENNVNDKQEKANSDIFADLLKVDEVESDVDENAYSGNDNEPVSKRRRVEESNKKTRRRRVLDVDEQGVVLLQDDVRTVSLYDTGSVTPDSTITHEGGS